MISRLKAVVAPLFYCIVASTTLRVVLRNLAPVFVITVLLIGVPTTNAMAGGFTVATCQADPLNYSHRAFEHAVSGLMRIKKACNPVGGGRRGVITSNIPNTPRIPRGDVAVVSIKAPAGTQMHTFHWAGQMGRSDCGFALQIWADTGPRTHAIPIRNKRANRNCPRRGRAQAAGLKLRKFPVDGMTRIVQRVACVGSPRRKWCSGRGLNFIQTEQAYVGITDNIPPAVAITPDLPLAAGAWVSGAQLLNYTVHDNVGVRSARAVMNGLEAGRHDRPCVLATHDGHFAQPLPCTNDPGQLEVNTLDLTEGTQLLSVEAQDAAGNAASSAATAVRIDNTPPARVDVTVEGGQGWRNRNDWMAVWSNPVEADRAPIAAAHYELCASSTTRCSRATQTAPDVARLPIAVPEPGEWTLSVWRADAAGNSEVDNASVPVTLRYDPEPPELAFDPPEANDPTRTSVRVTDRVSGLADGLIEIAATGSGAWQTLATHKEGSRLVTRIDDALLPAGTYALRARAHDQAGNEASTDLRADGQPMVVTLPLRSPALLQAGFERTIRRPGRRGGRSVILRPTVRTGYDERVTVAGRLATSEGRAIVGALVQLLTTTVGQGEQLLETLTTDSEGRFRTFVAGTSTQQLRLAYAGSQVALPSQTRLEMRVPAATSVRVSRRRLRNGQSVTFSGRVLGLPVPDGGKLVEVQVRFTDRWQTFRTTRSDASGRWSSRYRFQRTRGVQRYRFRVRLPKEGGYPFETSVSRVLHVEVSGK